MFDVFIGSCVLGLIVLCHFDHGVVPSGKAGARRRLHIIRLATDPTRARHRHGHRGGEFCVAASALGGYLGLAVALSRKRKPPF